MILYTDDEISDAMLCINYLRDHAEDDENYTKNEKRISLEMAFDALSRLSVCEDDEW